MHLLLNPARTGMEELTLLRSKLESLHLEVSCASEATNQHIIKQLKSCCDICQNAYHILGVEQRNYEEDIQQLKIREEELCQSLRDVTEQGSYLDVCVMYTACMVMQIYVQCCSANRIKG